jgi:hypothetical protein
MERAKRSMRSRNGGQSGGCSKVERTTHQSRQSKPSRVIVAQNPNIDPTAAKSGNFSPWRNRRRAIVISYRRVTALNRRLRRWAS